MSARKIAEELSLSLRSVFNVLRRSPINSRRPQDGPKSSATAPEGGS